jgi:hypothetical protein
MIIICSRSGDSHQSDCGDLKPIARVQVIAIKTDCGSDLEVSMILLAFG